MGEKMSALVKLNQARKLFHAADIKKTGHNKFAGYYYFELADFLVPALNILDQVGLCAVVSFNTDIATLTITDLEDGSKVEITSPMSEANLKGCHPIQNLGAVQTYIRRYLWVAALEIVEHDAVDSSEPVKQAPKATPTAGAWDIMDDGQKEALTEIAAGVMDKMADPKAAMQYLEDQGLSADEKVALWTKFDSKTRAALKKAKE
jgi:hypothetical protein